MIDPDEILKIVIIDGEKYYLMKNYTLWAYRPL